MKTFWRWAGTLFFFFAFVFLTVAGIGTSIPIRHSARCSAQVDAPAEVLFNAIADDGISPSWRPEVRSVVLVSGAGLTAVWRETYKNGQELTLRTVSSVNSPASARRKSLIRTIPFDPRAGFDGTWDFEVEPPANPGEPALVSIGEQGNIYNPVYRFLARYVFGYDGSIKTYLTDLAKKYGQTPAIACESSR